MQAILDTGPWVALIDRSEDRHRECVKWLKQFSGKLYSTEAVLAEVMYLLSFSMRAQSSALDFVVESLVELIPSDKASLKRTEDLMKKHADLPMDFADATIVCLAMETGINRIATFDKKDFAIYRLTGNKEFIVVP